MYTKELYLAGGPACGLQEVFSRIPGVVETTAGTAESVSGNSGFEGVVECVRVSYNPKKIAIDTILNLFFAVVNPYTDGIQGKAVGPLYRSAVCYTSREDIPQLSYFFTFIQNRGNKDQIYEETLVVNEYEGTPRVRPKVVTKLCELASFEPYEEARQHLLRKDPEAYTPIDIGLLEKVGVLKETGIVAEGDTCNASAHQRINASTLFPLT